MKRVVLANGATFLLICALALVGPDSSVPAGAVGSATPPLSAGVHADVVTTPQGPEAATWDEKGNIDFWKRVDGRWVLQGRSTYPVVPGEGFDTSVHGALLRGMSNAVFIAHGLFTGDGSGNEIAFTRGKYGWGTIAGATGQPLQATGHRSTDESTPGIAVAMSFRRGDLEVDYQNDDADTATDTYFDLQIVYGWNGHEFTIKRDNAFTVRKVNPPNFDMVALPSMRACPTPPKNGSYVGYWGVTEGRNTVDISFARVKSPSHIGFGVCTFDVGQNVPLTIQATSNVTRAVVWITVPIWVLFDIIPFNSNSFFVGGLKKFPKWYYVRYESPIYIAPGEHLRGIASNISKRAIATIRGGRLIGLTLFHT
jgi:hypothetical protein